MELEIMFKLIEKVYYLLKSDLESKLKEVKLFKAQEVIEKLFMHGIKNWRRKKEEIEVMDVQEFDWSTRKLSLNEIKEVSGKLNWRFLIQYGKGMIGRMKGMNMLKFPASELEEIRNQTGRNLEEYS
jgi:hypothetical protein